MRNAERGTRNVLAGVVGLILLRASGPAAAQQLPSLPEVHVLALARAPDSAIWVGTYGEGIYVLRPGASQWEHIVHVRDSAAHSISWDFVHAFGFGARGEIWYGTVGNGWGLSTDGGRTWRNWEFRQLGPEWQYVAPNGIVTRGDTVYVATADGIKLSFDDGATWSEITDSAGSATAARLWGRIANQYVLALAAGADGSLWASHLRGLAHSRDGGRSWTERPSRARVRALAVAPEGVVWVGTERGLYTLDPRRGTWVGPNSSAPVEALTGAPSGAVYAATARGVLGWDGVALPCGPETLATALLPLAAGGYAVGRIAGLESCRVAEQPIPRATTPPPDTAVSSLRHTWFRRPIALADQPHIDQTYRYGSTMGGNFQQHQGVEFNNPDGTPVHAIGDGIVVYAGPAEQGSNTVAIRHDVRLRASDSTSLFLFSTYYHNRALLVTVGRRVKAGDVIAEVGNTGRATNDHLHLEVHASPVDSVQVIVDAKQRYPRYTVNAELWIAPLPGTGVVAGQVWDTSGHAVPQARVYGLWKAEPQETPYSYAETYGEHNHPDPLYHEHFAVSDVPPGDYTLSVVVDGQPLSRRVRVRANAVTWVEFKALGRAH